MARLIWKWIQTIFFSAGIVAGWVDWYLYFWVGPLRHPVNTVIYFVGMTLMTVLIIYVIIKIWEYE